MEAAVVSVGDYWHRIDCICSDRRIDFTGYADRASCISDYHGDKAVQTNAVKE